MAPKRTPIKQDVLKRPAGLKDSLVAQGGTAPISADNLKKHTDFHKHVDNFQKGKITAEELQGLITNKDMQNLWKGMEYQRKNNPSAKEDWEKVCDLGRGDHKDSKKRLLLFAWLKEKKFGKHYASTIQGISIHSRRSKELKWLSWEELKGKYGEDEAKQRVKAGTCFARRDPRDNRFWQFLAETESMSLTIDQMKELQVQNSGGIKSSSARELVGAMQNNFSLEDTRDLWNADDVDLQGFSLKDLEEAPEEDPENEEGEDDGSGIHSFLKGKEAASSSKAKNKGLKPKGGNLEEVRKKFAAKLENMTAVGDNEPHDKAQRRVANMHSLLTKQGQSLKMLSSKATGAGAKELSAAQANIGKHILAMDKLIGAKFTLDHVKKALVAAASASKKAHAVVQNIQCAK